MFEEWWLESERAKGAEKASCGEMVVQKGIFGESVFLCRLKVFGYFRIKP